VEEILEKAKKVSQQAEVFRVVSQRTPVKFEANNLKQIQTKEGSTTALRLIKNGKIGFAQVTGEVDPDTLVAMALETCKFGAVAEFEFPGLNSYPNINVFDPRIEKVTIDEMVYLGEQLIAAIKSHTPEILCEASVAKGTAHISILNSKGGKFSYQKSFFSFGVEGMIVEENDILFVGDGESSCQPLLNPKKLIDEVIEQLELSKNKSGLSTRTMPVIFKPNGVASALISPLISAFNGKTVFMGASPLKDKLGTRVFDKKFSLFDDATLSLEVASCPSDDEGVPGQRTPLVEKGIVSQFIYDLQTAGLAGAKSTGNGCRGGGLPSPSINSIIVNNGTTSFKEMVANIKTGLIVEQLMGAGQGNVLNGDFSGNVLLGYKIENGVITGRVKDTMVSGNVYEVLKEIEAIGNDSRWVEGFLKTPSICCANLSVASKQ
jgi:PmbA protein